MTAGAHDAGGGFGRSAGTNAARGVAVIVVAVLVGLLLMFRGLSDSNEVAASGGEGSTPSSNVTDPNTTEPDDTDPSTTDPVPEGTEGTEGEGPGTQDTPPLDPPRDASEVRVMVLNGTDANQRVAGIGQKGTDVLKPFNYITLDPKNADTNGPSKVFYAEGYEAEAIAVAQAFGADPAAVVEALTAENSPITNTQDANIVVRIGSDGAIPL